MLRFQWNALRPGDAVIVHDPESRTWRCAGTVVTRHLLGRKIAAGRHSE